MTIAVRQRTHHNRVPWLGIGIIALLILIGLGIWAIANSRRPVAVPVVRRDISAYIPLQGTVVAPPNERAEVMTYYQAPVAKVYTSIGDKVKKGDVLVDLTFPSAQASYDQARVELQQAQTSYQSAERQYDAPVDSARHQLQVARRAERQARASVSPSSPNNPDDDQDTAGANVSVQEVTPSANAANLQQTDSDRVAAEQALTQAKSNRDAALAPYSQRLETAQAAFKEAQAGRKAASIRAPISGEVLALNAQPGKEVGTDSKTPVATIVNLSALQIQAPMSSDQAAYVKPKTPVSLAFRQLPAETFSGEVSSITSQAAGDRTTSYLALVNFKNDQGRVKPDMTSTVSVSAGKVKNVLAVPNDAIGKDSSGRPVVAILQGGDWKTTVVKTGLSDGHYTEIKSGLSEEDSVQSPYKG